MEAVGRGVNIMIHVPEDTTQANREKTWVRTIVINFALGSALWFFHLTDYSLSGTVADLLFPPFALGLCLFYRFGRGKPPTRLKVLFNFSWLPLFLGSGLPILFGLLVVLMPFSVWTLSEIASETQIQESLSPDGSRTAAVFFRDVGAYTGGNGRILVRVRHRLLPLLERDVYRLGKSYASKETVEYISWLDDDTLLISENQDRVRLALVKMEVPGFVYPFWMILKAGVRKLTAD
jgi:hypothetical protein